MEIETQTPPVGKIEEAIFESQVKPTCPRLQGRRCIYYSGEICQAPKLRFVICKTCYRISLSSAVLYLFQKIKALAIFLLQGFGLPPSAGTGGSAGSSGGIGAGK